MAQRSTNTDRVRLLVDRGGDGVSAGRVHRPAGEDPWGVRAGWAMPDGPEGPLLVLEYRPAPEGATDVEAYALTDEYAVRLPLSPEGEGADRVEVHRRDGRPVSARDLSKLGLGSVHSALLRVLSDEVAVEHLGRHWGAVEVPHPGRHGRGDLHYAIAARDYIDALAVAPKTPIRHMVEEAQQRGDTVTDDELRARLRRARERQLLTAAPKGRPGGELTGKAVELLRSAGLAEAGDG